MHIPCAKNKIVEGRKKGKKKRKRKKRGDPPHMRARESGRIDRSL
jgi:hypothetical protein